MDITSKQTQYAEDVSAYLTSKLPYVQLSTLMEIAEYLSYRTARLVEDSIAAALEEANKPEAQEAEAAPKTYREALAQLDPAHVSDEYKGGAYGCPGDHFDGAMNRGQCSIGFSCTDCWGAKYRGEEYTGFKP